MCGIVGFWTERMRESHVKLLEELMWESTIRGMHAYGTAWWAESKPAEVFKGTAMTDALAGIEDALRVRRGKSVFLQGHTRYSTSGDWHNNNNNQPIDAGGRVLSFNGVLDMRTKRAYEQTYRIRCSTENDGEIPLRLLENGRYRTMPEAVESLMLPTFAGIWREPDGRMFAYRLNRPIWYAVQDGATFLCSTASIGILAGLDKMRELPGEEVYDVETLAQLLPVAKRPQQTGRLSELPLRYDGDRRYGPSVQLPLVPC